MSDFDKLADEYERIHASNIRVSGFDVSYFDEYKIREIHAFLKCENRENQTISFLNFGCGIGKSERFIRNYFPHSSIFSVDVSEKSIEVAKERNKELKNVTFSTFDGFHIPLEITFDVVFIANVFHHVPFDKHIPILKNIYQRLNYNGAVFLFEHKPLNLLTVRTVKMCAFDADAKLLNPFYAKKILSESGFKQSILNFIVFFPKMFSLFLPYEKYLRKIPLGAQYYYVARKV